MLTPRWDWARKNQQTRILSRCPLMLRFGWFSISNVFRLLSHNASKSAAVSFRPQQQTLPLVLHSLNSNHDFTTPLRSLKLTRERRRTATRVFDSPAHTSNPRIQALVLGPDFLEA